MNWRPGDPMEDAPDDDGMIGRRRMVAGAAMAAVAPAIGARPMQARPAGRGFVTPTGTLESVATILAEIRDLIASQIPKGLVVPSSYSLTNVQPVVIDFDQPFFWLILINDGPQPLTYAVPGHSRAQVGTLNAGERLTFTFATAVINSITLNLVSAGATAVRTIGGY